MGIISPWRVAAGLKSYVGVVSGDTVLPVEWGFGRMEKDEEFEQILSMFR